MKTKSWTARSLVSAAALAVVILDGTIPANAASSVVATPNPVAPGGDFTVSGPTDCFTPYNLTIQISGLGLSAHAISETSQPWSVSFTAPVDAAPGTYNIVVQNAECSYLFGAATVTISGETPPTEPPVTQPPATVPPTTPVAQVAGATASAPAFTG